MARPRAHTAPPPPEHRRSTDQIVAEYGVVRRTVYGWQAEGRIHVWKLGAKNIYDRREFEAMIAPKRVAS